MAENTYCVYCHTFPNGKRYVGITVNGENPNLRWDNGWGYRAQPIMMNAILKYGWKNIDHSILHNGLKKEEAEDLEIFYISKWGLTNHELGYNIAKGGASPTAGIPRSEETKRKIAEKRKGFHHTEETKAKISMNRRGIPGWSKGIPLSPERKEVLLRTAFKKGCSTWNKGRKSTDTEREKLRQAHIGIPNLANRKMVQCVETGSVYESLSAAGNAVGGTRQAVRISCNDPTKRSGGFHWRWYYGS